MANGAGKAGGKGSVPFWLLVLGLVAMLGAFSRGEALHDASFDGIALDLGGAGATSADPAQDGYSPARKSNHAYAMVRTDDGRFYALYGPTAAQLGGVLVGDGEESSGIFSSANLREFSVEPGGLRVSAQEGRFTPARFVEGPTQRDDEGVSTVSVHTLAGGYAGRLSDATGTWPATLALSARGELSIDSVTCHARGAAGGENEVPVRRVNATFEAGCAEHGATLKGHAWRHGETIVVVLPSDDLDHGAVFIGSPAYGGQSLQ